MFKKKISYLVSKSIFLSFYGDLVMINYTIADITALFQLNVESYLDLISKRPTIEGKNLIDKLRELSPITKLPEQVLFTLQAPMDNIDFKDILNQFVRSTVLDIIEGANKNGYINADEQKSLTRITMKACIS